MTVPPLSAPVLKRPATPPPIRIRRNVSTLAANDPVIEFYGRAIGEMKRLLIANPLSWRYQAAIHDYPTPDATLADRQAGGQGDPLAAAGDVLPSDRATFWRQCQHFSWFFLPWHRMYLHHFERMIMDQVARLGGPSDWALPYWNWDASDGPGRIPVQFRSATLADGSVNHLHVAQRDPRANRGEEFATPAERSVRQCLTRTTFAGAGEFGGPSFRSHDTGANGFGSLEAAPHGSIHVAVGRPPTGFMRNFTKAPLDPIFWLHHCNIDRLWDVWLQRDASHTNPTAAAWLNERFDFHTAGGGTTSMSPSQVLNTRLAPLSYRYDDTSDPLRVP